MYWGLSHLHGYRRIFTHSSIGPAFYNQCMYTEKNITAMSDSYLTCTFTCTFMTKFTE